MFNSRKQVSSISKFDKKTYDFEKKKQMIEEIRAKDKQLQKDKEKMMREKEINSLFTNDSSSKSYFSPKRINTEENSTIRNGKSIDKSMKNKEPIKLPNEKEEQKGNQNLENTLQSQKSNQTNLINTMESTHDYPNQANISAEPKLDKLAQEDLSMDIIVNEHTINFNDSLKISQDMTETKRSENQEGSFEGKTSGNSQEEININRKNSENFKAEKFEKEEKQAQEKKQDVLNEITNSLKSRSKVESIPESKTAVTRKENNDANKEITIVSSRKISEELTVGAPFETKYVFNVSPKKNIHLINDNKPVVKDEKLDIKIMEGYMNFSPNKKSFILQNNEKKQEISTNEFIADLQKSTIKQSTVSPSLHEIKKDVKKDTLTKKQDYKKEIKREPITIKRDHSRKPEKKEEKKLEKKEIKDQKYQIKEDKNEVAVIKQEKTPKVTFERSPIKLNDPVNNVDNMINVKNEEVLGVHDSLKNPSRKTYSENNINFNNFPIDDDTSKIEENMENVYYDSERDIYNAFLYESLSHKDSLQLVLRDQMKNIISNIKYRKKEIDNVKIDKKKLILENLSRINESTISKDNSRYPKSTREIIIENSVNNSFFNQSEVKKEFQTREYTNLIEDSFLNKNQSKKIEKDNNLAKMIKDFEQEFHKVKNQDETYIQNENSSILNNDQTDNWKVFKKNITNHQQKPSETGFDLIDYLKENRDNEETLGIEINNNQDTNINGQNIYKNLIGSKLQLNDASKMEKSSLIAEDSIMFGKNKSELLVFGDYENPMEYEEKIKKLEKLREKKIKDMEKKKEESKFKSIATENNNFNLSIDSRMATERSKTPKRREDTVNSMEDKSYDIQFPAKKLGQVINLDNHQIHNYANKVDQSSSYNNEDKNKRANSSRSKSQMPAKDSSKNSKPQQIKKNEKTDIMKYLNNDIAPIKITRKEVEVTPVVKEVGNKSSKYTFSYNKLSNKKTTKSAIRTVCLAAEPHRACREKILEIIEDCPCENFLILFKGNFGRFDLKAVYTYNPQNNKIELLTCLSPSPEVLDSSVIQIYYKYDLIQKEFKILSDTKEVSVIVDAIAISSNR